MLAAVVAPWPAWAQLPLANAAQDEAEPAPGPASAAEVDALIAALEDPAARDRLIAQLQLLRQAGDTDAAAADKAAADDQGEAGGARLLDFLSERLGRATRAIGSALAALALVPEQVAAAAQRLSRPLDRERFLESVAKLAVVLGPAGLAQWLLARLLARPWRRLEGSKMRDAWRRILFVLLRFVLRLVPILAFAAIAYIVTAAIDLRPVPQIVALAAINATIVASALMAVGRSIVSPRVPPLRLVDWSDESAAYAMTWIWRFVLVGVYGYFLAVMLTALRAPPGLVGGVARLLGLVFAALAIIFVLQNRRSVAAWLHRGRELGGLGRVRRAIAEIWHVLAITAIALIYAVWALGVEGGFEYLARALLLSALVLAVASGAGRLVRRGTRRVFALSHERREQFPGLEARVNRYLPLLENLLLAALYFVVVLLLLQFWGLPTFGWLASPVGRDVAGTVVKIALIALIALVASEVVSSLIARYLTRKSRLGEPLARSARIRTLLPLLRNAFRIVLGIIVVLIVMSEIGIDIAPLLAGAGVVGLAIGFGAQTLVQDVITGIFILAEDTISVGDVVDVGGHAGVVEAMSIRSLRLREGDGSVHTVPFSEVKTVKNLTKDFSYAFFNISVAYREDVDEVIAVVREVGDSLRADEALGPVILDAIEIDGLDQFAESAMIIRARIKTLPLQQWKVLREFNRRLKQAFDARDIEMPFPYRTLVFATDKAGTPTQARVQVQDAGVPREEAEPEAAEGAIGAAAMPAGQR